MDKHYGNVQSSYCSKFDQKWVFQMDYKVAWGQQSQCFGMAVTKPWSQSHREFVGRAEKTCASKVA